MDCWLLLQIAVTVYQKEETKGLSFTQVLDKRQIKLLTRSIDRQQPTMHNTNLKAEHDKLCSKTSFL